MTSRPRSACPYGHPAEAKCICPSLPHRLRMVTLGCRFGICWGDCAGPQPSTQHWCAHLHRDSTTQPETSAQEKQNIKQNAMWKSAHILNASQRVNIALLQEGRESLIFFDERQLNFCILRRNTIDFH